MSAQRRPAPRTLEINYRTIGLPESVRVAVKKRRTALGVTLHAFIATEATAELDRLVSAVAGLGLPDPKEPTRPARLPLSDEIIEQYRRASEVTGLPANRLLVTSLQHAAIRRRRRSSKPRKSEGR